MSGSHSGPPRRPSGVSGPQGDPGLRLEHPCPQAAPVHHTPQASGHSGPSGPVRVRGVRYFETPTGQGRKSRTRRGRSCSRHSWDAPPPPPKVLDRPRVRALWVGQTGVVYDFLGRDTGGLRTDPGPRRGTRPSSSSSGESPNKWTVLSSPTRVLSTLFHVDPSNTVQPAPSQTPVDPGSE